MKQAVRLDWNTVVDVPPDVAPHALAAVWNERIARANLQIAAMHNLGLDEHLDAWMELGAKLAVASTVARPETPAERLGLLPA